MPEKTFFQRQRRLASSILATRLAKTNNAKLGKMEDDVRGKGREGGCTARMETVLETWLHMEYIVHLLVTRKKRNRVSPSREVRGCCSPTKKALLLRVWLGMCLLCMPRAG